MEIQQLRHMLAAAEQSSYAQAAKRCFTSRQNVAHSVKVLEQELGVTLFERKGNEMLLTPQGKEVAREAADIIARVDGLRVMFSTANPGDEKLKLFIGTNLLAGVSSSVDSYISDNASHLKIFEASCRVSYEKIVGGGDIAIVMCMERRFPQCDSLEVASSTSYALASLKSPLAQLPSIIVSNLKNQRLLLMSEPPFQYEPLFEQLDALGYDHSSVSVIPSTSSMIHMMKRSGAVGVVSRRFSVDPPHGTIAVPIADTRLNWHFYILYQRNSLKCPLVMRFIQGLRAAF